MTDEVKSITLSGVAATDYMGANGAGPAKKGGSRRKTQKKNGGGETGEDQVPSSLSSTSPVVLRPASTSNMTSAVAPPVITVSAKGPANEVPPHLAAATAAPSSFSSTEGGAHRNDEKKIRVELKKKGTAKRVQLQPKKATPPHSIATESKKHGTQRRVRHFTLGVSSLQKRMTRAKKMQKKVADMPLEKLKEVLIQKKLIKATSKAPESVLRQMAADAQIVAGKAL